MKKTLFILFVTFSTIANAQNTVANTATDISPLLIGEKIPNQTLKSAENKDVRLSDLVGKKKTVLVFYRGGWCPYCNLHLANLAQIEDQVLAEGYQVIAVSPDSAENLKITEGKDKVKYTLLSDSKGELSSAFGISYKAPQNYKSVINVHSNGVNKDFLPVPSVFVVDTEGVILFEYISPDYKNRISSELLLSVLKNLK
ncbi:peroxiredoxin-like family protein [Flavobacterium sp. FlaQc-52]|uniref:thioredoxin-dependent peroxiredoxin n=1 Tax=Flavobacterium cupriresistens TaxID=2893885 RepID=A0ABU4RI58_9FLAO|nr:MULTISPECIES: peroxiredoxin-like family protein [unclassified Flavobacterium]MDX6190246.1 peroxiredoxin-like family protein [Flavobacterium sp. Fl-318]UFH43064.1 AhpC/TSA family protein [Flavobacterium sp. F-323]